MWPELSIYIDSLSTDYVGIMKEFSSAHDSVLFLYKIIQCLFINITTDNGLLIDQFVLKLYLEPEVIDR